MFTETAKLATIFQSNHTPKSGDNSLLVISDASNDSNNSKEVSAEKKQFLLSGVPQELQKRLVQTAEVDTVNCPPWPTVSHVQQIVLCTQQKTVSDIVDVWNLPHVSLNIPLRKQEETGVCTAGTWELGSFLETWNIGPKREENRLEMVS